MILGNYVCDTPAYMSQSCIRKLTMFGVQELRTEISSKLRIKNVSEVVVCCPHQLLTFAGVECAFRVECAAFSGR